MQGIYEIKCLKTGTRYIGSAKEFSKRWAVHVGLLNCGKHHNMHLQRAWKKHGQEQFVFNVIEVIRAPYDRVLYFEREDFYIDDARSRGEKLYNVGGATGGSFWEDKTPEEREIICENISEAVTRALSCPEVREKMAAAKRNIPRTEEEKKKISKALSGVPKSTDTKAKMGVSQKKRADNDPQVAENMSRIGRLNKGRSPSNAIPITFRGETYTSVAACNRATGISHHEICKEVYGNDYRRKARQKA